MTTKAQTKKETARDRYLRGVRDHAAAVVEALIATPVQPDDPVFDFTVPSGMPFKLRKPTLRLFTDAGLLPAELSAKLYRASRDRLGNEEMASTLTDREIAQMMEFNAAVVKYVAVDPRIVENPTADDEIGYSDITERDFQAIINWATKGGDEAERLGTFRGERSANAANGAAGTGNGMPRKRKARHK